MTRKNIVLQSQNACKVINQRLTTFQTNKICKNDFYPTIKQIVELTFSFKKPDFHFEMMKIV